MIVVRVLAMVLVALLSGLPAARAACDLRCEVGGTRTALPSNQCSEHGTPADSAPVPRSCDHVHAGPDAVLASVVTPASMVVPILPMVPAAIAVSAGSGFAAPAIDDAARGAPLALRIALAMRI
jgi:hypothetical protein